MLNKIGYINSINYDGLLEELKPMSREQRLQRYWRDNLYNIQGYMLDKEADICISKCDSILCPDTYTNDAKDCYKKSCEIAEKIKRAENHNKLFNKRFEIKFMNDQFIGFMYSSGNGVVIPRQYADIEEAKDYSKLTFNQMNKLITGVASDDNSALAVIGEKTQKDIQSNLDKAKEELELAEKKAKEELEAFEQEVRKQELALRAKQEAMLAEFRTRMENMKDQIFLLEMNIFALRSYFGETFSIAHVMKGKNAPDDQPLVLFQKFRYMDEDLSRLSANSEFRIEKSGIIDLFNKYGDLFVETFCPNAKCITFFKASKDNKYLQYSREDDMIAEFEYYHGNQIGMIIRNGENVYLSFIDEEITLQDNLFVSAGSVSQEKAVVAGETKLRDKETRVMFNRKHIFIIIQALLKNTNIFESLKNEEVLNSNKIIFSNADAQIKFNKYPSFREYFAKNNGSNPSIKAGDEIFIDQSHAGSRVSRDAWGANRYGEIHRSKGYRNTARDADIKMGIDKLNIVERDRDGWVLYYSDNSSYPGYTYHVRKPEEEVKKMVESGEFDKYEPYMSGEYYVSCKRIIQWNWNGTEAKNNANLRLYNDEFMSIMFLNSNYIQQWIDNKEGGNGKNYVYFVKSLKELKEHLLKREEEEFKLVNNYIQFANNSNNKDILLDWKIKNKVRTITDYQAKRFSKSLVN